VSDDVIRLQPTPIDIAAVHDAVRDRRCGAVCCFEGTARDVHEGRPVASLAYEAYEAMALEALAAVARDVRARVPAVVKLCLVHRLGLVPLAEASVAVAASAPHRAEAFEACRLGIDLLKARAPIWKKESYQDGGDPRWVENVRDSSAPGAAPPPGAEVER
jgi:molybdopterin synthase catalytic subunit